MSKRNESTRRAALIATVLGSVTVAAATARGQSRQIPAPPQNGPVLIHSATVHPVSSAPIEGYVLFEKGVIVDVRRGTPPPRSGVTMVDAAGLHVYPGLIGADTTLGLTETGAVEVTNDYTETGDVKPEVRAAVAVNPDSDLIPVARANGILTAMVFPRGGTVSGRCSLLRLDGWTWEQMAIDADAGLAVSWPRTDPITAPWMQKSEAVQRKEIREKLRAIDRLFADAEAYLAARDNDPRVPADLRFEAMRAAITGAKPLFVRAASAGQIESAVTWARDRGYRIVIVGGAEADRVSALLRSDAVPVILSGTHRMPLARHDPYDQAFALPARLRDAGVSFAIASGEGSAHERNLNHAAATAAAYGLTPEEALESVTRSAAEILGVGDRLGTLEPGKAATLIVTTGDPLEITTDTLIAYIDGRRIDLGSRHKALYAKYREKYRQLGMID